MTRVFVFTMRYGQLVGELITEAALSASWDAGSEDSVPDMYGCNALWDTGATMSAISQRVADSLQLTPEGRITSSLAHGKAEDLPVYYVNIRLPNAVLLTGISVVGMDLPGIDLLIGMDVIGQGDLAISNWQGQTTLSFRMPSIASLDFNTMWGADADGQQTTN